MRGIVFDLDGTLIDSAPDIRAVANDVLAGEGAAPITLEETHSFIGNGTPVFVSRMMALRGLQMAEHSRIHAAFMARYKEANALTTLYPGVTEALAGLRAAGFALGICTNKPAVPTQAVLAHFGLTHLFGAVIGGDTLPVHKPDPAPLVRAFADLGAERWLYVGDSEVDRDTAIAAGVPFALFTEGYRKTGLDQFPGAHTFARFDAFPALIAGLT